MVDDARSMAGPGVISAVAAPFSGNGALDVVAELNHRLLNTLTVVQALAQQTFAPDGDARVQQAAFMERLRALCAINRLLGHNGWAFARLQCTLEIALAKQPPERWTLEGPIVTLEPDAAVDVAMVFDELATNAARHGALSGDQGTVEVTWRAYSDGKRAEVIWRERGAPARPDLTTRGFGLRLVEQVVTRQLGGSLHLDPTDDGLVCRLDLGTRRA